MLSSGGFPFIEPCPNDHLGMGESGCCRHGHYKEERFNMKLFSICWEG